MFTGIVEEVGTIRSIERGQHSAMFIIFIELFQTVCEKTECCCNKNTLCLTFLQFFGNIQHAFARGDHIINDEDILAFDG